MDMREWWTHRGGEVGQWLLDLFFPRKCAFCTRLLERGEEGICFSCQRGLPWTEGQNTSVEFCEMSLSPLWYRGPVRDAVHRYKFLGRRYSAFAMGTVMAQCLHDRWAEPVDVVVWVPLTARGLRRRGYDQAELLARRVGEVLGLPVERALEKTRDTHRQSSMSGDAARRANVLGAYRALPEAALAGKRVVLIDDVVTSGATLSECASLLLMAGAVSVVSLTLARAG